MVATRRQEQVEKATSAPDVRRSDRERKPVAPLSYISEPATKSAYRFTASAGGKFLNKNGKKISQSKGWAQIRKEQEKQIQNDKRRKTIPNTLTDPYTGDTVWIATATLQDIAIANKKHRPPWPLHHRYLVMVPSIQQRQIVYDRAAAAISELEERILPAYGGRLQWKCIVTIKENASSTSNKKKINNDESAIKKRNKANDTTNKKSPYFCWNKRGQLELAAWPYMLEKIPNPPHFPGYYKNGKVNTRSSNKSTAKSGKRQNYNNIQLPVVKQEPHDDITNTLLVSPHSDAGGASTIMLNDTDVVIDGQSSPVVQEITNDELETPVSNSNHVRIIADSFASGIDDPKVMNTMDTKQDNNNEDKDEEVEEEEGGEEEDDDDEDEELLSDDVKQLRELQERVITGLAELAYDERWRVSIPTIHYKWISPLQQAFYTRKSAWDHAIELCKNDVLLDKVLCGYGANGKMILPKLPTQSATFSAGKLRFIRDGLWIIGQEEQWIHERTKQEQNIGNEKNTVDPIILDKSIGTLQNDNKASTNASDNNICAGTQQQRPWTGLSLFIHKTRTEFRNKRLKELLAGTSFHVITPPSAKCKISDTDSSSSFYSACSHESATPIAVSPVTSVTTVVHTSGVLDTPQIKRNDQSSNGNVISKYTLVDATKELRAVWKAMAEDEKIKWNMDANKQNGLELKSASASVAVGPTSSFANSLVVTKQSSFSKKTPATFSRSKKWSLNEQQIQLCYDAGMEHYDQIMRTVSARDLFRELEDGFDLLRERGKGRWDMNLPEFDTSSYAFLNDTKKSPWMPVVREILGKDVVLIHKGIFLSMPGSSKQVYHQDGPHLTTQYQKPCHAINVFVPLVDLDFDNGPTEFCLGSHILGYDVLDEDYVTIPTVSAGTPIIFDYRLGHRGLGNSSTTCRPILYCTYAASADGKEFRDSVNFSRKRYHRIGDLVDKGLTRAERAEKRLRT